MTTMQPDLLTITNHYLRAIEANVSVEELLTYYAETVEQIEYPNQLVKQGATRSLKDLKDAYLRGRQAVVSQSYEVQKSYVVGNTVILEAIWAATLAISFGQIPAGGEMKAYLAQFIEFEEGKIIRQRTYDCYEPF